tara:strand:+ start:4480 stop:7542 length:3063 start_codon:yes stop_codon:yes gene_type:complete
MRNQGSGNMAELATTNEATGAEEREEKKETKEREANKAKEEQGVEANARHMEEEQSDWPEEVIDFPPPDAQQTHSNATYDPKDDPYENDEPLRTQPLKWLDDLLVQTTNMAVTSPILRTENKVRYGTSDVYFATCLHELLNDNPNHVLELGSLVGELVQHTPMVVAKRLRRLLHETPVMFATVLYAEPTHLDNLPQILAASIFSRLATPSFDAGEGSDYAVFISRLQWIKMHATKVDFSATADKDYARLVNRLQLLNSDIDDGIKTNFALPESHAQRLRIANHDFLPTPAAVIAAIGIRETSPMSSTIHVLGCPSWCNEDGKDGSDSVPASTSTSVQMMWPLSNQKFVNFVRAINHTFWHTGRAPEVLRTQTKDLNVRLKYLLHMRAFLKNVHLQLRRAFMPCDRSPIVSPWYASIILSARTYAAALVWALADNDADYAILTNVDFTMLTLDAIASGFDDALRCEDPFTSLCNTRAKSMYINMEDQDAAWWVLLRLVLSGTTISEAVSVAAKLTELSKGSKADAEKVARIVFLCLLMHTQTGMVIVSYGGRDDSTVGTPNIRDYPLAKLLIARQDPMCGQNAIDVIMSTYSGTRDLSRLASNDLAFTSITRVEEAWRWEIQTRSSNNLLYPTESYEPPEEESVSEDLVFQFCATMGAIAMEWAKHAYWGVYSRPKEETSNDANPDYIECAVTGNRLPISRAKQTLWRLTASHTVDHCGEWLEMAWSVACFLEIQREQNGVPPLISSPFRLLRCKLDSDKEHIKKYCTDEAWMRHEVRLDAQYALTTCRRDRTLWHTNNTLVLVAWLSTPHGLGVFARIIGERGECVEEEGNGSGTSKELERDAHLLYAGWKEERELSGADSIVDCALAFERALNVRNAAAFIHRKYNLEEADRPRCWMPSVPNNTVDREHHASIVDGALRYDPSVVKPLDDASNVAMKRIQEAVDTPAVHDLFKTFQVAYRSAHAVAVAAIPPLDANYGLTRHEQHSRIADQRWPGRAELLRRLATFDDMEEQHKIDAAK